MKCPICGSKDTYSATAIWRVCDTCKDAGRLGEWVYEKTPTHTYVMIDLKDVPYMVSMQPKMQPTQH